MILLDLLLTLVVYLTAPIIIRKKTGGVTTKKAKRYALLNSVCGAIFFIIVYAIFAADATVSMTTLVVYYLLGRQLCARLGKTFWKNIRRKKRKK